MARAIDQAAVGRQQSEIDAPGIHADPGRFHVPLAPGNRETLDDFMEQAEGVPVEAGGQLHRLVGEAADFFDLQSPASQAAQDHPPAFGAQICRKITRHAAGHCNSAQWWIQIPSALPSRDPLPLRITRGRPKEKEPSAVGSGEPADRPALF